MSLILGIDTSNYTTSTALYDTDSGKMLQSKRLLPVKDGALGLRQSDAVFHHTVQLSEVFDELTEKIDASKIAAVGVSSRPRPVDGSYMPCFLVGENAAKMLARTLNIPCFSFSHQEGHIAATLFSAQRSDLFTQRFIAFHVSGGTTEAVLAQGDGRGFSLEAVAKTLDLHAGQAIDRVGLMLGLKFPCGAQLEKLSLKNNEKIKVKPVLKGCDCCLSGVENLCKAMLDSGEKKEKIASFCIEYIKLTLDLMSERLLSVYGKLPLVFSGGVMSDSIIREYLQSKYNAVFARPEYSTDNAAGIAYLAGRKFNNV